MSEELLWPGAPRLGYCAFCLDLLWNDLRAGYSRKSTRIDHDPGNGDGPYTAATPGAAVDAFERGAWVFVDGARLRLRADVLGPEEPRCVDHYRIVQTPRNPVFRRGFA